MISPSNWISPKQALRALKKGTGRGVRIAILDSGIESSHPALAKLRIIEDLALREDDLCGFRVEPGGGKDLFGHGSAVASLIAKLAPEAEIGSFRVLGDNLHCRTRLICEGARLAIRKGYHILNCSFGCSREDQVLEYKHWVDGAYLRACHVVAASNNNDPRRVQWPAHFSSVIAVDAIAETDPLFIRHRPETLVEFGATGVDVEVAWLGGATKRVTGSSFAVPHVVSLLARLLSEHPGLLPLHAKTLLRALAKP